MITAEEVIGAVVEDVEELFCEGCPELRGFVGHGIPLGFRRNRTVFLALTSTLRTWDASSTVSTLPS